MSNERIFEQLMKLAADNQIRVLFCNLTAADGRLYGNRIAIRAGLPLTQVNRVLAHELAHYYLHYDKGNTMNSPTNARYEEQAERAAKLLLNGIQAAGMQ